MVTCPVPQGRSVSASPGECMCGHAYVLGKCCRLYNTRHRCAYTMNIGWMHAYRYNVVKTIINQPFGDGLYHLEKWWNWGWFFIIALPTSQKYINHTVIITLSSDSPIFMIHFIQMSPGQVRKSTTTVLWSPSSPSGFWYGGLHKWGYPK